jgi:diaminohydroxyphosphoribosylaminopyrimidine deaminase/5-amino-6-(5-phosphoribosylamino)uracil reductase
LIILPIDNLKLADPDRRAAFLGVTVIDVNADGKGQVDLAVALKALGERGLTRVLVEGGAGLTAAFLSARLVDRLVWGHAPMVIGGDGISAVGGLDLAGLADSRAFQPVFTETVGDDVLTSLRGCPVSCLNASLCP